MYSIFVYSSTLNTTHSSFTITCKRGSQSSMFWGTAFFLKHSWTKSRFLPNQKDLLEFNLSANHEDLTVVAWLQAVSSEQTHSHSTPKHNLLRTVLRKLFTLWFLWTLNRIEREGVEGGKKQPPSHWVLLFVSQSKMTYDMKNDEKPVGRLPADWFSHRFILF